MYLKWPLSPEVSLPLLFSSVSLSFFLSGSASSICFPPSLALSFPPSLILPLVIFLSPFPFLPLSFSSSPSSSQYFHPISLPPSLPTFLLPLLPFLSPFHPYSLSPSLPAYFPIPVLPIPASLLFFFLFFPFRLPPLRSIIHLYYLSPPVPRSHHLSFPSFFLLFISLSPFTFFLVCFLIKCFSFCIHCSLCVFLFFISKSIYLSICLCISQCLSVYLSGHLSVCLYIYVMSLSLSLFST